MKTSKNIFIILLIAATAFGIQSCKKDSTESSTTTDDTAAQMQHSTDESNQTTESEYALNDANDAMNNSSFGKSFSIVGATIDSVVGDKKVVITYNGNNVDGTRNRTGQITVQLTSGNHWRDANAVITITFTNFKVTRNATGKSLTFNGTHTVTNVSGGLVSTLTNGNSVTHKIEGTMNVTFDDGTTRSWMITRQRIIGLTSTGSVYVSISGFGTKDGLTNIVVQGTNRVGGVFYTIISTPVIFSSSCSWTPISGVKVHKGIDREITVTFGVDQSGNAVTSTCPYGFKINWTNIKGDAKQAVISY